MRKAKRKSIITLVLLAILVIGAVVIVNILNRETGSSKEIKKIPRGESTQPITKDNGKNAGEEKTNEALDFTKLGVPIKYNDKGIPVLMFHSIQAAEKGNTAIIPPEKFKEDMDYLKENGYYTLTLDEAYSFLSENKPVPEKSVVITFDDGYENNYTTAYPILKELNFKATIFVITSYIDTNPAFMKSAQLRELDKNGIAIESHTITHPEALMKLTYQEQLQELKGSKEALEGMLSKQVNYLAYPYGVMGVNIDKNTVKAAQEAGYKLAFTTDGRWSSKVNGLLSLDRVFISPLHSIKEFANRISNSQYKIS